MNNLSIIQEYALCAVNEKGKISSFSTERLVCFVAAGLLELQLENVIAIDGKKVAIARDLPSEHVHLKPLYDYIREKEPVKLTSLVEAYAMGFSAKRLNELTEAVGESLVHLGAAEEGAPGLMSGRKAYVPNAEALKAVVEMMRAEMLEAGEMSEEAAALVMLLEKSKCLKAYFSDFERKEMKQRVKALMGSPNYKLIKELMDHVDMTIAAVIISTGT